MIFGFEKLRVVRFRSFVIWENGLVDSLAYEWKLSILLCLGLAILGNDYILATVLIGQAWLGRGGLIFLLLLSLQKTVLNLHQFQLQVHYLSVLIFQLLFQNL